MKLETFITNFNTDGNKEKYVKSVIKKDYIPYVEKCNDCQRIVRACHYKDVAGERRFSMNSPAQAMMFALLLVDRYAKIDIEYSAETYDELQKCGGLGMIIAAIPEAEYQEYSTLMHMAEDDMVVAETNVAARLDDLRQLLGLVFAAYSSAFDNKGAENGEEA